MPTIAPIRPPAPAAAKAMMAWFADHGRDYPWRRTRDPYAVLVSEMMLQQTRVATVLDRGYYTRWMEQFPDVHALAAAEEPEVLRAWEGLGYYARARNLHKAAKALSASGGQFPDGVGGWEQLPGIGPYTARAVAAFARDAPVPVVDANVTRVLARLLHFRDPVDSSAGARAIFRAAEAMVPKSGGRLFNSAIMELGQRICLPRRPDCPACPVARWCAARPHQPENLPVKSPRRETIQVEEHAIFARRAGMVLLRQESGRRRHGLWKLPDRPIADLAGTSVLLDTRYFITHHHVRLLVHRPPGRKTPAVLEGEAWIPIADLAALPMPAPYRRALDALLSAD